MKWGLSLLSTLGVAAMASLEAADEVRIRDLESRVAQLEQSRTEYSFINPSARFFAPKAWGTYLEVDALLWRPQEGGLPLAVEQTGFLYAGNVKSVQFDWSFGFRAVVGLNTAYDAWDLGLSWVRWDGGSRTDIGRGFDTAEGTLFPSQGGVEDLGMVCALRTLGEVDINLDLLDLQCGKRFFVSKRLAIRPYTAVRSGWIKQRFNAYYRRSCMEIFTNVTPLDFDFVVRQKNRYFGIGLLGGIELDWGLPGGLSICANYNGSILYGFFSVKTSAYDLYPEKHPFASRREYEKNLGGQFFRSLVQIGQATLGIRYDWVSFSEYFHIGAELGWQLLSFPSQNQLISTTDVGAPGKVLSNQGDLGIEGYFLSLRVDF